MRQSHYFYFAICKLRVRSVHCTSQHACTCCSSHPNKRAQKRMPAKDDPSAGRVALSSRACTNETAEICLHSRLPPKRKLRARAKVARTQWSIAAWRCRKTEFTFTKLWSFSRENRNAFERVVRHLSKGKSCLLREYPTTIRCVAPNSPHLQLALGSCCKDECHESHLVETDVTSAEVRCVVERWNVVQFGSLITLQRLDSRCSDQRAQTILATIRIAR